MKEEEGKIERSRTGPMDKNPPSGFPNGPIPREWRNSHWAMISIGALVLSLVAFVSGVRMGKTLTNFR